MKETELRELIIDWVKRDGEGEVEKCLIDRLIPASTRSRLVKGSYPSDPKGLLRATLEDALKQAGLIKSEAAG